MNIVYALQPLQKSLFLAGPTPRDAAASSWRPAALHYLEHSLGFDGTVFVPESADWLAHDNYDAQVRWEWEALDQATVAVFWVDRDLVTMPAFTTNVEFGLKVGSGRCVLGHPEGAPKCGYLDALAKRFGVPVFSSITSTLAAAVDRANQIHAQTLSRL